jgi:hypothetical protein
MNQAAARNKAHSCRIHEMIYHSTSKLRYGSSSPLGQIRTKPSDRKMVIWTQRSYSNDIPKSKTCGSHVIMDHEKKWMNLSEASKYAHECSCIFNLR